VLGVVEGKGLVGGGSGEAGTAMQMQGLSAVTPVTLLGGYVADIHLECRQAGNGLRVGILQVDYSKHRI
jgi:hypothetical protein